MVMSYNSAKTAARVCGGFLLAALVLGGCAQLPRSSVVGKPEQVQVPEQPESQANGAIYQSRQNFQPLFEDRRPRHIGDILTIVIKETSKTSQSLSNSNSKSGKNTLAAGTGIFGFLAAPGQDLLRRGISDDELARCLSRLAVRLVNQAYAAISSGNATTDKVYICY